MLTSHDLGMHIHKTQSPRYQSILCPLSSLCQKDQPFLPTSAAPKNSITEWNWQWSYEVSEMSMAALASVPQEALELPIPSFPSTVEKGCLVGREGKQSSLAIHVSERPVCEPASYHETRAAMKTEVHTGKCPSLWGQRFNCCVSPLILSAWSLRLLPWRTPISVWISFSKANRWQIRKHEHLWYPSSWTNSQACLITGSVSPPSKG